MVSGGHVSGATVDATITSFTVLAGIMTGLRLYTRTKVVKTAGVDDVFVCIGLLFSIVLTLTMCEQVKYGMGRHVNTLTPHDGVMSLKWFWGSVWVYYLALWAVKISILCQYLRILPENGYRKACFALMGVVSAWTVWAFFSAVFACRPVNAFWVTSINGTCLNRLAVWFANAAANILTDVSTAVLPLPVLNSLCVPRRQKYVLMVVFGLGGVTCLLSVLRLQSLYVISKSVDISWDNPLAATWSSLEVNVGIICSCLPTLRGLVARWFPALKIRTDNSHRSGSVTQVTGDRNSAFQTFGYHSKDLERNQGEDGTCSPTMRQFKFDEQDDHFNTTLPLPEPAFVETDASHDAIKEDVKRPMGYHGQETERRDWFKHVSVSKSEEEKARAKVRQYVQSRTFERTASDRKGSDHSTHGGNPGSISESTAGLCESYRSGTSMEHRGHTLSGPWD